MSTVEAIRKKWQSRMDANTWEEELHPRDENGKFASKEGGKKKEEKPIEISGKKEYNNIASNGGIKPTEESHEKESKSVNEVVDKIARQTRLSKSAVKNLINDMQKESIHNQDGEYMMLGKGHGGGENSYVSRAEANGDTYFSMGDKWEETKRQYGLNDRQMFDVFNAAALDKAMSSGKKIRFCDEPKMDGSGLSKELRYLIDNYSVTIVKEGDYWYAE